MTEYCLLYNREEKSHYRPDKGKEFICSDCVQKFLYAGQEELKQVYDNPETPERMKRAIRSFLIK